MGELFPKANEVLTCDLKTLIAFIVDIIAGYGNSVPDYLRQKLKADLMNSYEYRWKNPSIEAKEEEFYKYDIGTNRVE